MSSSYTWCNITRVTPFLNCRFEWDLTVNKTLLDMSSIWLISTYLHLIYFYIFQNSVSPYSWSSSFFFFPLDSPPPLSPLPLLIRSQLPHTAEFLPLQFTVLQRLIRRVFLFFFFPLFLFSLFLLQFSWPHIFIRLTFF